MSSTQNSAGTPDPDDGAPPAKRALQIVAALLLSVPLIALIPVGWYSRRSPELAGFPFFVWYQMVWVFLCAAFTYSAYVVIQRARPHRPMTRESEDAK